MGQVNVNYDERVIEGIDRLRGTRGLSRAELLRAIATEAVEAHDAGWLAFQIEDGLVISFAGGKPIANPTGGMQIRRSQSACF